MTTTFQKGKKIQVNDTLFVGGCLSVLWTVPAESFRSSFVLCAFVRDKIGKVRKKESKLKKRIGMN